MSSESYFNGWRPVAARGCFKSIEHSEYNYANHMHSFRLLFPIDLPAFMRACVCVRLIAFSNRKKKKKRVALEATLVSQIHKPNSNSPTRTSKRKEVEASLDFHFSPFIFSFFFFFSISLSILFSFCYRVPLYNI